MKRSRGAWALGWVGVLFGCHPGSPAAAPLPPEASLVLLSGHVVTQDAHAPRAQAVVIDGERIRWVGDDAGARRYVGAATRVVSLGGALVVPGLTDAHGHLAGLGRAMATLDLTDTPSFDDVLRRVHEAAARQPEGWIVGRGWDQSRWPDQAFPDGRRLDEVAAGRSIWLDRVDGHAVLVSPAVLARAGIDAARQEPAGGRILRDATGAPTGVLIDRAVELAAAVRPEPSSADLRADLLRGAHEAARVGLTEVHDMGVDPATLDVLGQLDEAGELPIRIYAALDGARWGRLPDLPPPGRRLTVRAVKLFADGALGSRGAALLEDYTDAPGDRGLLGVEPATLRARVEEVVAAGWQPCVHAIGDHAARITLDALEAALAGREAAVVRPRLEHAQVLHPSDLPRLARLGVIASMQPTHATSDMVWAEARLGAARLPGAYAWRSVLSSGAALAFGSDFPVERPHVLEGLFAAVTRQSRDGEPPGGWRPGERLRFGEALAAFTQGAAYAAFAETRRGVIRAGADADLTVVGAAAAPLAERADADPRGLLSAGVVMTVVGGRVVHDSRGRAAAVR